MINKHVAAAPVRVIMNQAETLRKAYWAALDTRELYYWKLDLRSRGLAPEGGLR